MSALVVPVVALVLAVLILIFRGPYSRRFGMSERFTVLGASAMAVAAVVMAVVIVAVNA